MSKPKTSSIDVLGTAVAILTTSDADFISWTDMLKAKDGDFFISDWLRNRNTVEFLGIWETVHNPRFNYGEFATIRSQAGLNHYKLSIKEWVEKTNSIGLKATAGRYGGTFAHRDIAFEFGLWISPEFKIYLIKEFQRLKDDENRRLDGNVRDHASIEQLLVLANIEGMNAEFIHMGLPQRDRLTRLNAIAIRQMRTLTLAQGEVQRLNAGKKGEAK